MKCSPILATTAVLALAAPAAASAHVTLQPPQASAGGYTVLDVRVPNERDDAATTKVRVQMPDGFASVSTQPVPGWTANARKTRLATPIKTDDGPVDTQVSELDLTATGKGVEPGHFQDFPLSVKIPDGKVGSKLTFKALQTYSDGQVVRWIGPPDADQPAPQVTLTAAQPEGHGAAAEDTASRTAASSASGDSGGGDGGDDGSGDGLAIVALVVGALGLVAGAAGLVTARRATA